CPGARLPAPFLSDVDWPVARAPWRRERRARRLSAARWRLQFNSDLVPRPGTCRPGGAAERRRALGDARLVSHFARTASLRARLRRRRSARRKESRARQRDGCSTLLA